MRRSANRATALSLTFAASMLAGCATTVLPLCPRVAQLSYPTGSGQNDVNRFVHERATEKGIKINALSTFAAAFSGYLYNVRWLEKNYPTLLCAFESGQVVDAQTVYLACMSNAPRWIAPVQSEHPENLMLDDTHFKENCARS